MKRKKPWYGSIGSVSTATMRPEDLIPAFLWECNQLRLTRDERATVRQIERDSTVAICFDIQGNYGQGFETVTTETTKEDARKQLACYRENEPQYSHRIRRTKEDITSSSEYWQEDAGYYLEDLFNILDAHSLPYFYFGAHPGDGADYGWWLSEDWQDSFDGLTVSDTAEIPKGHTGEVLHISDHGNPTLYSCVHGRMREVWSLV